MLCLEIITRSHFGAELPREETLVSASTILLLLWGNDLREVKKAILIINRETVWGSGNAYSPDNIRGADKFYMSAPLILSFLLIRLLYCDRFEGGGGDVMAYG